VFIGGILAFAGLIIGALITFLVLRHNAFKRFSNIELEAKARAKVIKSETDLMLKEAHLSVKTREMEFKKELQVASLEIEEQNRFVTLKEAKLEEQELKLNKLSKFIDDKEQKLDSLEIQKQETIDNMLERIENIASITQKEAKDIILKEVEKKSRNEIGLIVRKYEQIAKEDAQRNANYILAQATTRFAGEFAGERLINIVTLPSDEHKGRIIGKEGRNIKSLEMLLGVDIVIDETPGVLLVSSFNLYRRAIATEVIEILVNDGRIHPAKIEEIFEKVTEEFEKKTYSEGRDIVMDLGLMPMHEDLIRLIGKLKYRASYGQNALAHTLEVAKLAGIMAAEMGGDEKLANRAGILHDIGKALTQEQGGSHVDIGVDLCRRYNEHPVVINAIYAHHGHEEAFTVESAAVCAADTLSAARTGARREVLESFSRRVKDIEDIATSKEFVTQAYAINAGREIRVIVNASKINDNEAKLLGKEIAKEIEDKVQYPAEIKVSVIRETRSTSYAR